MKRFHLVLETAAIMLICSAGVGSAHLWKAGQFSAESITVALIIPALATLLYFAIAASVPDLFAVGRLRFPLNLTLPLIYLSLIAVVVALFTRVGVGITRLPERLERVRIWGSAWLLLVDLLACLLSLSALAALDKEKQAEASDGPAGP